MKVLSAALAAILAAGAAQATVTTYSDEAAFLSALGASASITTESFSTDMSGSSLTFDSGVTATSVGPAMNVSGGRYRASVDGSYSQTWNLLPGTTAFGFYIDNANSLVYEAVQLTVDDGSGAQDYLLYDVAGGDGSSTSVDGYVGFIGTGVISSITFSATGGPYGDTFWIDDATFASASSTTVPLPAGAPLLLAGLAGFGLVRRRRG